MDKLLNQLILIAGAWQKNEDPVIEQQFSILFEELKQITKLDHEAAVALINNHRVRRVAA
ncbi:hypothetical protein QOZ98_000533 [Planomicrobium stackebrandtii]|uniref:Uncharacterized protein n=1 Tax=Planomicrobium stackebrandtii TaxID=253160 RepID=A0ABU0GQZ2_9BACL|nr:hypothetical protein [Planomicrobium stackebrandtii]MDQ0427708.1 hypothetical protein [Planomicrobium stackebrandtii]